MPRLTPLNGLYNISSIRNLPLTALIFYLILLSGCCRGILFISDIQLNFGKGTCVLVKKWKAKFTVYHEQQIGSARQEASRGREKNRRSYLCDVMQHRVYCNPGLFFASGGKKMRVAYLKSPGAFCYSPENVHKLWLPVALHGSFLALTFKLPWFLIFF